MNEQLIVKNFGPIRDATVDFKRVTVFIGPTGGGKSTLAKLAAVFRDEIPSHDVDEKDLFQSIEHLLNSYSILNYQGQNSFVSWQSNLKYLTIVNEEITSSQLLAGDAKTNLQRLVDEAISRCRVRLRKGESIANSEFLDRLYHALPSKADVKFQQELSKIFPAPVYVPSERVFASAIEGALFGLRKSRIALPEVLEGFMSSFENARKEIHFFDIPFLEVSYSFREGENKLQLKNKKIIELSESASGVQSVLPLLLVVEYFTNDSIARGFIVEEPELNLYPTAQQNLLNILVEKCTKGENDLTITTHSSYLLAHFNLLLYAFQVAEAHPERADEVAKIVPRESWINPKEFAAYHVEGQQENGVRSIVNPETGLVSYNGLDAIASAETSEFEKLLDINAGLEVA